MNAIIQRLIEDNHKRAACPHHSTSISFTIRHGHGHFSIGTLRCPCFDLEPNKYSLASPEGKKAYEKMCRYRDDVSFWAFLKYEWNLRKRRKQLMRSR